MKQFGYSRGYVGPGGVDTWWMERTMTEGHGPDWWVASDGEWYPPELHPDASPPASTPDGRPGPDWWVASDGKWYPPELHPEYSSAVSTPDGQPGPDWWVASDGKWYPPELHPDYSASSSQMNGAGAASVSLTVPGPTTGPVTEPGPPLPECPALTEGVAGADDDAMEKVRRLGGLLDAGRLSDSEFQQMRKEILGL